MLQSPNEQSVTSYELCDSSLIGVWDQAIWQSYKWTPESYPFLVFGTITLQIAFHPVHHLLFHRFLCAPIQSFRQSVTHTPNADADRMFWFRIRYTRIHSYMQKPSCNGIIFINQPTNTSQKATSKFRVQRGKKCESSPCWLGL